MMVNPSLLKFRCFSCHTNTQQIQIQMNKRLNCHQGGRGGEKDDREITASPGSSNKGAEKPKSLQLTALSLNVK